MVDKKYIEDEVMAVTKVAGKPIIRVKLSNEDWYSYWDNDKLQIERGDRIKAHITVQESTGIKTLRGVVKMNKTEVPKNKITKRLDEMALNKQKDDIDLEIQQLEDRGKKIKNAQKIMLACVVAVREIYGVDRLLPEHIQSVNTMFIYVTR